MRQRGYREKSVHVRKILGESGREGDKERESLKMADIARNGG